MNHSNHAQVIASPLSDDFLSAVDLATELRLTPNTVRKWGRLGVIPCFRVNSRVVFYSREAVRQYMAKYLLKEVTQ
jgi:hypothetical protein